MGTNSQQIERKLDYAFDSKHGLVKHSHKRDKMQKHRQERRRAKKDPLCLSKYRKYEGWEW